MYLVSSSALSLFLHVIKPHLSLFKKKIRTTFYFCFFLPPCCFFSLFWFLLSFRVFLSSPCLPLFLPVFLPPLASALRRSLLDRTDPSHWMHCSVGVKTEKLLNTWICWQAVKLVRCNTGFLKTSFSQHKGLTEISSVDISWYFTSRVFILKVGSKFKCWIDKRSENCLNNALAKDRKHT